VRTIVFENAGEIDPVAIATFGISVKECDSPIGFFGTGLKYALSILLRSEHVVLVQSGLKQHEFGLREVEVRGEKFSLVTMDGQDLGFTTRLGVTWKTWQAYRELHCNCADEGGRVYEAASAPEPEAGSTRVIVTGDEFAEAHDACGTFILQSRPTRVLGHGVEVHPGPGRGFFFKGILVHEFQRQAKHVYNLTRGVDLTEDRTAKFPNWDVGVIAAAIRESDDDVFVREMLLLPDVYMEGGVLDYCNGNGGSPKASDAFMRTVEGLAADNIATINPSAARLYQMLRPEKLVPLARDLTVVEQKQLDRAIIFCKSLGFGVDEYPIVPTESLGAGILGLAKDGRTYLSTMAFDRGTKCVAGTLVEEWAHTKHHLLDCSRDMQNWLLDRMVGLGERVTGEPL
jgi:hypothetical protein